MAKGRKQKIITKEQLLNAMKMTKSNMSCARYLGISYMHYSRYAKSYIDEESGKTLFDLHKNQAGKGIRKHLGGKDPDLKSLMEGELYVKSYNLNRYKDRLIQEGYIEEKCNSCGFLYIGDVFNEKQIKHIEEDAPIKKDDQINWEMDENMLQHFQEIGLVDEDDSEDYISRI